MVIKKHVFHKKRFLDSHSSVIADSLQNSNLPNIVEIKGLNCRGCQQMLSL